IRSTFHAEYGVYVDPIVGTFHFCLVGKGGRASSASRFNVGPIKARCLEPHDLALSKLAARRLQDNEAVAPLTESKLVDHPDTANCRGFRPASASDFARPATAGSRECCIRPPYGTRRQSSNLEDAAQEAPAQAQGAYRAQARGRQGR